MPKEKKNEKEELKKTDTNEDDANGVKTKRIEKRKKAKRNSAESCRTP